MGYQLLVLDIDGTVTNSKKEVLDRTLDAVIRVQEKGIRVVLASGRPPEGIFPIADKLRLDRFGSYILSFNGGKIIDYRTRQCIFERQLPRHIPLRLWQDALKYQVGFAVYKEGIIVAGTRPDSSMAVESAVTGMPIEYHENFGKYLDFPVNECLITGSPEDLESLEAILYYKYFHETHVYHSEPCYLEVTPKNVDKAYGLKHLMHILQISSEEMVCCGDGYNDIRMLQYAGLGVAMANAPDKVKMVADYVTVNDNDNNGVAEVIERYLI